MLVLLYISTSGLNQSPLNVGTSVIPELTRIVAFAETTKLFLISFLKYEKIPAGPG